MTFAPIEISHDPAPDLQMVYTPAVIECNRLAAINAAKLAYLRQSYKPGRLPPKQRVSHLALLGVAFVCALPLAVIGVGVYAIAWAVWTGIK